MTKILVTGANGMLGQDLCPILQDEGFDVIETDVDTLDITDSGMVSDVLLSKKPSIVIHCAAYTNVDKAEEDLETATKINVKERKILRKSVAKTISLLFISRPIMYLTAKKVKNILPMILQILLIITV